MLPVRRLIKATALLPTRGKFSRRQNRIGTVSAKRMNRRFYKGKGIRIGGKVNRKGIFIKDPAKITTIIAPEDMSNFELGPYVEHACSLESASLKEE